MPRTRGSFSMLRAFGLAMILALIGGIYVRTFLVQAFHVPSNSMEPGLQVGDRILVNKFIYGDLRSDDAPKIPWLPRRETRRGDVVVLISPRHERYLVKRCVGLPGDTLEISQGSLYVNRRPVDEGYLQAILPSAASFEATTLPLDRYFFLGDHRARSEDSRVWGALPANHVVGQGFVIYWSEAAADDPEPDRLGSYSGHRLSWFQRVRWRRFLKPVH